jgi:hypothetical protein
MALLDGLEAEGKHATAKLALAYLRKFFGWCAERDAISEVPTYRIRLNGSLKPRERALSLDELRRCGLLPTRSAARAVPWSRC